LPTDLQRDFYAEMCRIERWSVRTLRDKIRSMLYERTAISKRPAKLAKQELAALRDEDRMTPDLVFRDPYVLDFLGLADTYSKRDHEQIELLQLSRGRIRVAEYLTELPPRHLLEAKLHEAISMARAQLAARRGATRT